MTPVVAGYRGTIRDVPAFLARLQRRGLPVQLLRADRVYGADHLKLAALLAQRAYVQGRARTADVPTETLLYAAGERQVGKALAFLGLAEGMDRIAAVGWCDEATLDLVARVEGWTRDDAVLEGSDEALDAFGVTAEERALLPPSKWGELVLERVALVDVLKA